MDQYHIHLYKLADKSPSWQTRQEHVQVRCGTSRASSTPIILAALPRSKGKLDLSPETHTPLLKVCVCVRERENVNDSDTSSQSAVLSCCFCWGYSSSRDRGGRRGFVSLYRFTREVQKSQALVFSQHLLPVKSKFVMICRPWQMSLWCFSFFCVCVCLSS